MTAGFGRAGFATSGFLWTLAVSVLLCASAALGFALKSQVLGPYTQNEALDFMSVITGFLVTTAAVPPRLGPLPRRPTTEDRHSLMTAMKVP